MFIWIAIIAYTLFALNGIVDKFLLSRAVRHPIAYAFYIGITGPLTWFLIPFGLKFLGPADLAIAILGGAAFIIALYFLYVATQATSISRLLPIEGGFVPVFTLILAYLLLGERLSDVQLWAFIFLVSGAVLIAFKKEGRAWHPRALASGIVAAFLFALSLTLTKYIFDETNFVSGLVWTRLGFLLTSLAFLIPSRSRRYIFNAPRETTRGNKFLYYGSRASGGLAGLLQNYAISAGSVTIVNALQGTQFAILLILTLILSRYYPRILKEKASLGILAQKITAIILITAGLILVQLRVSPAQKPEWGVNFSIAQAGYLKQDWKKMYLDMLEELKPRHLRTMAYWSMIEPEPGKFNFADIDFLLKEAEKRQVKVILAVGRKLPRWPECHEPDWIKNQELRIKNQELLEYIEAVINRYKDNPAIWAWQVENEPFFSFGPDCPSSSISLYREELNLVKSLDPKRLIVATDSGEKGAWLPTAWAGGDILGSTMYREIYHHKKQKYIKYPIPPALYQIKAGLVKSLSKTNQVIGVELQAEPWFITDAHTTVWAEQIRHMNREIFLENVNYARRVGFAQNYFWGVEWWYWAKEQGHPEMWEEAKSLLTLPSPP